MIVTIKAAVVILFLSLYISSVTCVSNVSSRCALQKRSRVSGSNGSSNSNNNTALMNLKPLEVMPQDFFNLIVKYGRFIAASLDEQTVGAVPVCSTCKLGKIPSATVLSTFHIKLPMAIGFVGVDHSLRSVVLAFGIVHAWRIYVTAWNIYLRRWPPDLPGSYVYEGLAITYETMKYEVIRQTEAAMSKYPGYELLITGHSQGGAYTTFSAYDLAHIHPEWKITALSSGSPRVGNPIFAGAVNKLKNVTLYRLVYHRDGFTRIPSEESYVHVNTELFVDDNDQLIKCNAMEPFGEDPRCSARYSCDELREEDHYEYFNQLL